MNTQTRLLAAVLLAGAADAALAKPYCGELNNAYGPFDYRVADQNTKDLVEHAHFTEEVEAGQAGHTSYIGADIDYTLRVFPNHPRALATMIRLTRRGGANSYTLSGAHYPTECYFERAVRWQADDAAAWSLYAQYLYTIGKDGQAMPMLQKAVELDPDNPTYNYNLGLVYAKKKQYDLALPLGQKAYAQGFPLPGLKQMLVKAGKWVEPPPAAAPAAAEEQAAPASQPAAATAEASSKP